MPSSPSVHPSTRPREQSHLAASPAKESVCPVFQASLSSSRPQSLLHRSAIPSAVHALPGAQRTAASMSPEMSKMEGGHSPGQGRLTTLQGSVDVILSEVSARAVSDISLEFLL